MADPAGPLSRHFKRDVARAVWYLNHRDGDDWLAWLNHRGYVLDTETRARFDERRISTVDGRTVGVIHDFGDEAFGFVFVAEYGAPWWHRARWRVTHPFTPRRPIPWRSGREACRRV